MREGRSDILESTSLKFRTLATGISSLSDLPAFLERGFSAAKAVSLHSNGFRARNQMGAAIFSGGRLLSIGSNQYNKSLGTVSKNFKLVDGKVVEYTHGVHAEQQALVKLKHIDNTNRKLSLFVYREDAEGIPTASGPCKTCQQVIKQAGISKVYFFDFAGNVIEWRVSYD